MLLLHPWYKGTLLPSGVVTWTDFLVWSCHLQPMLPKEAPSGSVTHGVLLEVA